MASLTKASILIVASALMLTASAFASKQSELSIGRFSASGKPAPCFVSGEIPKLEYTVPFATVWNSGSSGCVIKLRQQSDGNLVWREYIPSTYVSYETDHNDLPGSEELLIPGLESGNYIAEIWVKGRMENSLLFSVSGRTDYSDNTPAPHRVVHKVAKPAAPETALSQAFIDFSLNRLDAFVGLTNQQRAEAREIYLTANPRMLAIPSTAEGLPAQAAIRREIKTQIRARLTPDQQKLFDDDRSPGPAVSPPVAKLDELVNLTPGQKALAEKIFANETLALERLASTGSQAKQKADIQQKTIAQIRTLLLPKQQRFYDMVPQSSGGGRITQVASSR